MAWFKREKQGVTTSTKEKKETPEGLWYKCPKCKEVVSTEDHALNYWICPKCEHHERISAAQYFDILFDNQEYELFNEDITSADPLGFVDTKKYADRVQTTIKNTGLKDALRSAFGKSNGQKLVVAAMDFGFIGGSMGSVVGEKIALAAQRAIKEKAPLLIISKSGGARMMEAGFSLMQMAKTSAKLTELADAGLPYVSLLTDPTTGGVTASFAMLGDINIAEPKALIGFAGPRVVRETIGRDLPEGFQTAEFVLEHGFLDFIVKRNELKDKLSSILQMMMNK
ncbi:MAG: acetyl-CoA carboxylase, carboxyltransferase subunit beta [Luteibaculaceae bacterium]